MANFKVGYQGLMEYDTEKGAFRYGSYEAFPDALGLKTETQTLRYEDYLAAHVDNSYQQAGGSLWRNQMLGQKHPQQPDMLKAFEQYAMTGIDPLEQPASQEGGGGGGLFIPGLSMRKSAPNGVLRESYTDPTTGVVTASYYGALGGDEIRKVKKLGGDSYEISSTRFNPKDVAIPNKMVQLAGGVQGIQVTEDTALQAQQRQEAKAKRQGSAANLLGSGT